MEYTREDLQKAVAAYLEKHPGSERTLAETFGTSIPTITRWATGVSAPHHRIAKVVIEQLKTLE